MLFLMTKNTKTSSQINRMNMTQNNNNMHSTNTTNQPQNLN